MARRIAAAMTESERVKIMGISSPRNNRLKAWTKHNIVPAFILSASTLYSAQAEERESLQPMEPHLTVATLHEKVRLIHLHTTLKDNPDYAELIRVMKRVGGEVDSSLMAMFFESSVEGGELSYGIQRCSGVIPYCVNTTGDFDINHFRVSFYADRLKREPELMTKILQAISYHEAITQSLSKGPVVTPNDLIDASDKLVEARAHFYQLMHENGPMGLSGLVSAPEALSLSLFNAANVSKMSSPFSEHFIQIPSYTLTDITDTKVLEVNGSTIDVGMRISLRMNNNAEEGLIGAFNEAFSSNEEIDIIGDGLAYHDSNDRSVVALTRNNEGVTLCLGKENGVSASIPADSKKVFDLIRNSELRLEYNIANLTVDIPLVHAAESSVTVRIPYEDNTRTRRIRTTKIDCNEAVLFPASPNEEIRVKVSRSDINNIKWTSQLFSNL